MSFALLEPLGAGGMGQVFRARHQGPDAVSADVAVKVMHGELALDPDAGLDHPAVVLVLDYGQVPEHAAVASEGLLAAGSPDLVTELAKGTLSGFRGRLTWTRGRSSPTPSAGST